MIGVKPPLYCSISSLSLLISTYPEREQDIGVEGGCCFNNLINGNGGSTHGKEMLIILSLLNKNYAIFKYPLSGIKI